MKVECLLFHQYNLFPEDPYMALLMSVTSAH